MGGSCCIIMPLRGPTCKIARFQAQLKFPSRTDCGNKEFSVILSRRYVLYLCTTNPFTCAPIVKRKEIVNTKQESKQVKHLVIVKSREDVAKVIEFFWKYHVQIDLYFFQQNSLIRYECPH